MAYYEKFTGGVVDDPTSEARARPHLPADGQHPAQTGTAQEAEKAYRQAMAMLEPLATATDRGRGTQSRHSPGTRTLLANLLVRRGADNGEAAALYREALEAQQALANAQGDAGHRRGLASPGPDPQKPGRSVATHRTVHPARSSTTRLLRYMERRRGRSPIPRRRSATNWRWLWIREAGFILSWVTTNGLSRTIACALEQIESLVAEFPTVPRHREVLAKVCNDLGLLEKSTGRLADAETHLRELLQVDRLVQDFPDRPEHRRELARTLMNLGNVLSDQNRTADAEPFLRRSIEVNTALTAKNPPRCPDPARPGQGPHQPGRIAAK